MITIEQVNHQLSQEDFDTAYSILINAYAITEVEIWGENYFRISKEEYRNLITLNEVYFARLNNKVVGCVHLSQLSENTYSFGLLAADFSKKGLGIGRMLINTAEQKAIEFGGKFMELEILKPANFEVQNKMDLHNWYSRLGYEYTSTGSFLDLKPDKAEKAKTLITPSVFDQYRKVIA